MHGERRGKIRDARGDAKDVGHQRAAAGAELDQPDGRGRAGSAPRLDQPGADDLAEHLADLRRGGEIAGRAEGIARHVVAVRRDRRGSAPCIRRRSSARSPR